jgi:ribosomal protein L6P/L9E
MKWYGNSACSFKNIILNKKHNMQIKNKKSIMSLSNRINLNYYKITLCVNPNWNFLILKHKNKNDFLKCYLFSDTYYFYLSFPFKFLLFKYYKNSNVLEFNFFFKHTFNSIFWNYFKSLYYSFSKIFYKKLKFKGKGYYIYKNYRNTIALQMGYSHRIRLYSFFTNIKFVAKTVILIFGINKLNVNKSGHNLFKLKPISIFTGRGIRFSKQIIYRKTGKISTYR